MPKGTALYVRQIGKSHGTPKQFAKKCADHKLGWVALAGCWQDVNKTGKPTSKMINSVDTILRYGVALEAAGVKVHVWGYPWQGREEQFVEQMFAAASPFGRVLLDPELGANPTRSTKGSGKKLANEHAEKLVRLFDEQDGLVSLGLSTFGSGARMGWFPLSAFTKALVERFGGRSFIGGQTYTDDSVIDRSVSEFGKVIEKSGGIVRLPGKTYFDFAGTTGPRVAIVPNFGVYARDKLPGGKTKVRSKSVGELRAHLHEFIDDHEPIDALIGWAENFMKPELWVELARFVELMERGACSLPKGL